MKHSTVRTNSADGAPAFVVRSDDGDVCFRLCPTRHGLWVQRERRRSESRARLVQSTVFGDAAGFMRWCDADSVRFDYPIVFSILRREGNAILDAHEHSSAAPSGHEPH